MKSISIAENKVSAVDFAILLNSFQNLFLSGVTSQDLDGQFRKLIIDDDVKLEKFSIV